MMKSFRCFNLALFLVVSHWTEWSRGMQCYQGSGQSKELLYTCECGQSEDGLRCKTTEQDRDGKAIYNEGEKDGISVLTTRKFLRVRLQTPFVLLLP